jgi:hypothetical protein
MNMKAMTKLVSAVLFAAAALPVQAGMRYEATTRTVSQNGKTTQDFVVEGWVDGEKARIEFRQAKGAPVPDGGYLITTDGGTTMYMVNPKDKQYMRWDLAGMLKSLTALTQSSGGMIDLRFTDSKVEDLGAGEDAEILGYHATSHKYRASYHMEMKVIGFKKAYSVVSEDQVWTTTALDAPGFGAWLRKAPPKTGDADLDKLIATQAKHIEGVPLRTVSHSTMTDSKGKTETSNMTMEVTKIEETPVDAAMFTIPDGYEEVEMPDLSAAGRDGQQQGDEDKDESGLKGLFKKFKKKK